MFRFILQIGLVIFFLSGYSSFSGFGIFLHAQTTNKQSFSKSNTSLTNFDTSYYNVMRWRCVGPWRGGRSLAVAGHTNQANTYYFGATGGGVWKTTDGGETWNCISDTVFTASSIGAIAVAPTNPNTIYVGTGEAEIRGNISYGDGMYKSNDAGKTWQKIGLPKSYAISTLAVHPNDENTVFACALGNVFSPNPERGLYKTKDGGKTWELVLAKNDSTGAVNVIFDPGNPNIMYACLWQAYRNAYSMSSGGQGSGLYKSTDGGETWKNISTRPGLPKGVLGKICIAISPANTNRIWAMIENENGGLYRSNDAGATWQRINEDKNLRQRPWYFSQIYPDPKDEDILYVLNVGFWRSIDGGGKFNSINVQHGDCHDLWIDPNNPERMILGDDGGAEITTNGCQTWTQQDIPTAQFYHVVLDNDFPYNIYGAQQDNSSIRIASRTNGWSIDERDWYPVAGGEAGYILPHPENSLITFGGEYDGQMTKYNKTTGQNQTISVYPEGGIGNPAKSKKERFAWTFPIAGSPHNPNVLYVGSQHVHKSTNQGASWQAISPDLTRNDSTKQMSSGGPITKDNTGAEVYCTVFAIAESPIQPDLIWAGSDDGLIHLTTDGGKNWRNVTPSKNILPEWALISIIDPSSFDAGTCYVAATRYKLGDQKPYLLKTTDFGKTWHLIVAGLPANAYTRAIRHDPNQQNLLYAGTERGIFVSFNNGDKWQSLQLNLPLTPIHDLRIHPRERDLVVATHGRSFWVLDNLTPLHELCTQNQQITKNALHLFKPKFAYRMEGGSYYSPTMQTGQNAPNNLQVYYYLKTEPKKSLKMRFLTEKNDTVATFYSNKKRSSEAMKQDNKFYENPENKPGDVLPLKKGLNLFNWNMYYDDATRLEEATPMWHGGVGGPQAIPGKYRVELLLNDTLVAQQPFEITKDPRITTTNTEYAEQLEFALKIRDKLSATHECINQVRKLRKQVNDFSNSLGKDSTMIKVLNPHTKGILDTLQQIEDALVQHRAKATQDLLAHPVKLNDKLAGVKSTVLSADAAPTAQSYAVYADLAAKIDEQLSIFETIKTKRLKALNQRIDEMRIDAIRLSDKK